MNANPDRLHYHVSNWGELSRVNVEWKYFIYNYKMGKYQL